MIPAARRPSQIALFTDFGEQGPYLGQMESVLYAEGLEQPVIRLLSNAPRCNPRAAAYLLAALAEATRLPTLFLSVVDPGVGGERLPLVVRSDRHWFVGPDNGLFSRLAVEAGDLEVRVIDWRPRRLSASFHGRDLFAPVAAGICRGTWAAGRKLSAARLVGADWPQSLAEVVYVDHYGNLMTGIRADALSPDALVRATGHRCRHARTFSDSDPGAVFWYENSIGLVELAVNSGSAGELLGLGIGDPVEVI